MSDAVLFELRNIQKEFIKGKEKITIFDDLSLKLKKGDFIAIMGPSEGRPSSWKNSPNMR